MRAGPEPRLGLAGPLVVPAAARWQPAAVACARRLGGQVLQLADWVAAVPPPVVVWWDDDGPGLRGPPAGAGVRRPPAPGPPRPGRDLLLRALGGRIEGVTVTDATAGWGVDAGVAAAAGAQVLMLEHAPAMALVLEAALARWRAAAHPAAARLRLRSGDAALLLPSLPACDVVYLDPLFPGREQRGTSAVELRWLREVARWSAPPAPDDELLAAALAAARRRVVVKRGRNDPPFAGVAPSGRILGRTTRYDLYAGGRGGA